jgi:hypothetical protein
MYRHIKNSCKSLNNPKNINENNLLKEENINENNLLKKENINENNLLKEENINENKIELLKEEKLKHENEILKLKEEQLIKENENLKLLNESSLKLNNNLKEFIETKIENLKKELKKEIIESNKSNINIENCEKVENTQNIYFNDIDLYEIMANKTSVEEACNYFLFTLTKTKNLLHPINMLIDNTGSNCPIKVNNENNLELFESKNNVILDIDGKQLNYRAVNLCKDAFNKTYNIRNEMCVPDPDDDPDDLYQERYINGCIGLLPSLNEKTKTIEDINKLKLSGKEIKHIKNRVKSKIT